MARALVLLADGFEEVEAVTPIDVLRRAGVEVTVCGISGRRVTGAHGIVLEADATLDETALDGVDLIFLPGGMPGAKHLGESAAVRELVARHHAAGGRVAAICAAPAVALPATGVLAGRRVTCYPGFERQLPPDATHATERVVIDGPLVTSRGPGTALEASLALVELLVSPEEAVRLRAGMLVGP